jgi:hypothetical protein
VIPTLIATPSIFRDICCRVPNRRKRAQRCESRASPRPGQIEHPDPIRETGDKVEITERAELRIVFLIEKANQSPPAGPV